MRTVHLKPITLTCLPLLCLSLHAPAATVSPLFGRGYTVLPSPQKVTLGTKDFDFTSAWRVELSSGVNAADIAVTELRDLLSERFHLTLQGSKAANVLHLAIAPDTVKPSGVTTSDVPAVASQAYRLTLAPDRITITGNTATGLYYGVGTFVQLLKNQDGRLHLPEAEIEDWPDLELRSIYWDDAHHLEHLDVLKAALRQASFYKINGFALKLEGHFQYEHAKPIIDPYALTPAEFQELTDYGLKYHVQLIPYLDGPAHDAFILKYPEYKDLREYPDSNYEFCATNPKTYELLEGMFDDLLAVNKGVNYFVLSTDEPYYVGLANNAQCQEAERAKQLGSVGKVLGEFMTKAAGYLHDRGRKVIFWGEYPMKPDDIASFPPYLINGEVYGPEFDPVFRAHGIRQLVYTSTEGEEQFFPEYYPLSSSERLHPARRGSGRVQEMLESISFTSLAALSSTRPDAARSNQADLMGVFVAGWADAGLHPETFWLGYATGPAAGWNRAALNSHELQSAFYSLFYGSSANSMGRLYQLMSQGAQFWEDSWETGPSAARKPIWGNSYRVFDPPQPAHDQFLPPLPVPSPELLHIGSDWRSENARRLQLADDHLAKNDQLLDLLTTNTPRVQFNRYNLEVYLSIANLYRQNLVMLQDLGHVADLLKQAEKDAAAGDAGKAVESLDSALDTIEHIRQQRNKALQDATATWYQSWWPRVAQANGRTYLHELDDVKDHEPMRTIDMSYFVYRELLYPLGDWADKVVTARNEYATAHKLETRKVQVDWKNTSP
jgi:hexosaminidase